MCKRKHFFPERLRILRKARGWSQTDLASKIGFKPSAISHFESGRREPSLTNFIRIAKALNVNELDCLT